MFVVFVSTVLALYILPDSILLFDDTNSTSFCYYTDLRQQKKTFVVIG